MLKDFGNAWQGIASSDFPRFGRCIWEIDPLSKGWVFQQSTVKEKVHYGGRENALYWENGHGAMTKVCQEGATFRGVSAWEKRGVVCAQMGKLPATLYNGEKFDNNSSVVTLNSERNIAAAWCFCSSDEFVSEVRKIDQKMNVTNSTLAKVPFDLNSWSKVAEQQYPNGLPQPYTNDPTQWIFHGHPCGSVIWDEASKWTVEGELRVDDTVLQVAVARLLGYCWPAELDPDMELAAEQRAWVERCAELADAVDDDGIVCLPAVRGEKPAAQRLEALLQTAYGPAWTTPLKNRLLEEVGSKSLDLWLRDKFFEQHCKLFQHRPFIWHIWDGLKDGFSALVNYHQLDKTCLERLIYTYLDDWISQQKKSQDDGADIRLAAAESLKKELQAILQGEPPYDIFVRWKPLSEQPIGWNPDLNDGVRLNIRPFLKARDVAKKDAGILRWKPNIHWKKDRGKDVESAPWYELGLEYGEGVGARINDHHLSLAEKHKARESEA